MSAGGWTPSMQKEHEFQMHKVVRGAAEAYQSNAVLQSEKALFHDIAMEHQAKRAKTIRARFRADSRKTERLSPTQPLDFSLGGCVFVEPDCLDGFGAGAPVVGCQLADVSESGFRRIVRQNGMQRVDDPIDAAAGYIVVASLKDPGRANYWVAVLSGGALVTPDYFASGGKSGSCLCWHAAVQIKRGVWMSPEWQRDEPLLASLLQWATRLPASKWRLHGELDSRAYVARQKKQKTLIGIISVRQRKPCPHSRYYRMRLHKTNSLNLLRRPMSPGLGMSTQAAYRAAVVLQAPRQHDPHLPHVSRLNSAAG